MRRAAATKSAQAQAAFLATLRDIVGRRHVLVGEGATRRYRSGFRFGGGGALAVARPGTLVEQWRLIQACGDHDVVVIMQAANTGLTGGSTPSGADYDRDVVIISTLRLKGIHLIDGGKQVICLPGATLSELEGALAPIGREPHSVIGSSCIGASVLGGICNNSGGSLIERGPAYTELAIYAQRLSDGALRLVNHLGVELGHDPETILARLQTGDFTEADIQTASDRRASDSGYAERVRDVEADTPSRHNADPERLFEASGSAGRLVVFAVRLDTFPREEKTAVFYLGTNDPEEFTAFRRDVLTGFETLPISAEYIHRTAFQIAERYGKDVFLAIELLGADLLPTLFAWKARIERWLSRTPFGSRALVDHLAQAAAALAPSHLPRRMVQYRDAYEHHLMVKVGGSAIPAMRALLAGRLPSASGAYFECSADEGRKAFVHRFAVANAAVRYRAVHSRTTEDIVALDVALRRNDLAWFDGLQAKGVEGIGLELYYGHFFCHVFHLDYLVNKGAAPQRVEHSLLERVAARGARFPAEHNVGHLYPAGPNLEAHYRALDPCNSFNPGIGHTSKCRHWGAWPIPVEPLRTYEC